MLLRIAHETNLNYSDLIHESIMELRMCPRQEDGQRRLAFALAVGPPATVTGHFDWWGNVVHAFTITPYHRQIRIIATSLVDISRPWYDLAALTDHWPLALAHDQQEVYDCLQFGGPVVDSPALRALVDSLYAYDGILVGELVLRMLDAINNKFIYQQGVTTATSTINDVLAQGAGVCQDFTHLMIAMARALGIPARYVSGLVHPAREQFRGASETHAWAELYFPSTGWLGFDPANHCVIANNFVKVSVGRDYRDVPPNKGLYRGSASETIKVTVHSEELTGIPAAVAPEHIEGLKVEFYGSNAAAPLNPEIARHQQDQQQKRLQRQQQQQQQQSL